MNVFKQHSLTHVESELRRSLNYQLPLRDYNTNALIFKIQLPY